MTEGAPASQASQAAQKAPAAPDPAILEANLAALAGRQPGLADLLRGTASGAAEADTAAGEAGAGTAARLLSPLRTASGLVTATLGGLHLHSAHDPVTEAARLAASIPPAVDSVILLGFGLGYQAEALLARGRGLKVLACVAEPALLVEALSLRDLGNLLSREELGFVLGGAGGTSGAGGADPGAVVPALDSMGPSLFSILANRAEEKFRPEWYAGVRAAAERYASKETINGNTLKRFGRLWVRNLARNMGELGRLPGVARLEGRFAGIPALVLAAGPSLDEALPCLRELKERCLLIAVDTSLRSLLREGVEPDFLVVVDPQYWNWRHLEGLSSPSSILVSESAAWPAVFRFDSRAAFLCSSLFPLGRAIEARTGAKGKLGAGGSVTTTAWDLGRLLGAAPLYMAGLDLGFPRGATHARASLFEQRAISGGRRLAPAETSHAGALFSGGPMWAPANDGEKIRTDKRMTLYSWWFESRLCHAEAPRTLNLSSHGLAIPGMGPASLAEILALPSRRAEIDTILDAAVRDVGGSDASGEAGIAAAGEGLSALLAELSSTAEKATQAAMEAEEARRDLAAGRDISSRMARLDGFDRELLAGNANEVVGFLLPSLSEIMGEGARSLDEGLRCSEALYSRVAESALFHIERLEASGVFPGRAAGSGA
jgi:hypothetical protein